MSEERFVRLESKLAFQENVIDKLDEVLRQQQQAFDALRRRIEVVERRLDAALRGDAGGEPDESGEPEV